MVRNRRSCFRPRCERLCLCTAVELTESRLYSKNDEARPTGSSTTSCGKRRRQASCHCTFGRHRYPAFNDSTEILADIGEGTIRQRSPKPILSRWVEERWIRRGAGATLAFFIVDGLPVMHSCEPFGPADPEHVVDNAPCTVPSSKPIRLVGRRNLGTLAPDNLG